MYGSKDKEHAKRKAQDGSYSMYNHLYHYLMDNYEPSNMGDFMLRDKAFKELVVEGMNYSISGGRQPSIDAIKYDARKALQNFCANKGEQGNTSDHLGNGQANSLDSIKASLGDLRW